ncbi:HK97-gp10 family putative phage morphogenesis protein [Frigidibacter sp. MR17.24]|uniref:HK97-gp10 family putative phage morphogenesis protein n=1 Tax=Frigidibacter sp. MR17.24 TaxID=3127345 RepID=UPI003012CB43
MADQHSRLQARLRNLPKVVRETARRVMEQNARDLVREMVKRVPKDTGDLADSIRWTWGTPPKGAMVFGSMKTAELADMTITIYAGNSATARRQARSSGTRRRDMRRGGDYDSNNAFYQEFGTSKMRANPFFRPAIQAKARTFRIRMNRAVQKAVKEAWNG